MDLTASPTLDGVKAVLVETLGIQDRAGALEVSTPLLDNLPELDSLAVVELVARLEQRFGITVDGEDLTAEAFETVGSLAALVDSKRS